MATKTPEYSDVQAAARQIAGHAVMTPVVSSKRLDLVAGTSMYLKDETAQHTRSFKDRGANNRLRRFSEAQRANGVVAYSSGNHAQAIAYVARALGMSAVLVMPKTAPDIKKQRVKAFGGEIVEYDPKTQSREHIGAQIARRDGRVLVPAYEDFDIVAGQGTCGDELITQMADLGETLDAIVVPLGGGGLCAGIGLAVKATSPGIQVYGAEPMDFDDHFRSLARGQRVRNSKGASSLCDALLAPTPGAIPFALHKQNLNGVFRVTDAECLLAMQLVMETTGIELEPGGAAAIAALCTRRHNFGPHDTVGVILSGGNVDPNVQALAAQISADLSESPAG